MRAEDLATISRVRHRPAASSAYPDLGDLEGARELFEQVACHPSTGAGGRPPRHLGSINNLAATRQALGDLRGARDLKEQTLARLPAGAWRRPPKNLQSTNNLASVERKLEGL
jgi:hypothetical protein